MAVSSENLKEGKKILQRNITKSEVSTTYHSQGLTKQPQITQCMKKQKRLPKVKRKDNHQWRPTSDNQDAGISR